jgi:hypothetical protein
MVTSASTMIGQRCAIAAVACAVFAGTAMAQGNIRLIIFNKVKLDRIGDFRAAEKDYAALSQKTGSQRGYTVWASLSGDREFAIVRQFSKWDELQFTPDPAMKDTAAAASAIMSRIASCVESSHRWIDEIDPALSAPRGPAIPPFVRTGRTTVAPDKVDEMIALYKSQIVPAMQKAEVKTYGVARARFGTPSNEFHSFIGLQSWAELDGPVGTQRGMSAAEWAAFQAKVSTVVQHTQWDMWTYWADASFVPAR